MGKVLLCLMLVFAAGACSDAQEQEARDVAEDAGDAASDAGDRAADYAGDAADKREDVVNDRTVNIDNFTYEPEDREVSTGTEVTWVNQDDAEHTVTDEDGAFESERLAEGEEFSHRFTEQGTFTYFCEVHGKDRMSGTVTVDDA